MFLLVFISPPHVQLCAYKEQDLRVRGKMKCLPSLNVLDWLNMLISHWIHLPANDLTAFCNLVFLPKVKNRLGLSQIYKTQNNGPSDGLFIFGAAACFIRWSCLSHSVLQEELREEMGSPPMHRTWKWHNWYRDPVLPALPPTTDSVQAGWRQ